MTTAQIQTDPVPNPAQGSIRGRIGKTPRLTVKIPLATRIKARNLYVLQQVGAPEVAKATGLKPDQVYSLASREGWTKIRKQIKADTLEAQDARALADRDELVEATAMEAAELTLGTFDAAKKALAAGGEFAAKDVQAYSQATKNYVGLYRQAKSLDANRENTLGVNVLFIACARAGMNETAALPAKAEPINVTPAKPDVTQVASEA